MARNNFIETRNLPLFIVFDLIKNTLDSAVGILAYFTLDTYRN